MPNIINITKNHFFFQNPDRRVVDPTDFKKLCGLTFAYVFGFVFTQFQISAVVNQQYDHLLCHARPLMA